MLQCGICRASTTSKEPVAECCGMLQLFSVAVFCICGVGRASTTAEEPVAVCCKCVAVV